GRVQYLISFSHRLSRVATYPRARNSVIFAPRSAWRGMRLHLTPLLDHISRFALHCRRDLTTDDVSRPAQRVRVQVTVLRGGGRLRMPQQLADDGQAKRSTRPHGRKAITEIMEAHG